MNAYINKKIKYKYSHLFFESKKKAEMWRKWKKPFPPHILESSTSTYAQKETKKIEI